MEQKRKERKKRISVRCNGTHARVKKMKMGRKDGHRKSVHPTKTRTRKSNPHRSPRPRALPKGPTREKL
ncbi:hypothetical protein V1477_012887 [Vespula maculifrons]|uniref:Uncharacterized protein n=1 Tax=Vespula maculifrons TaxID=7453 RepID=A0ABD2BUB3_VESMC